MRKLILIIGLALVLMLLWASTASAASPPASGGFWHRVRYGETLSSIGWRYGVSPYRICAANQLYNCNYIRAGQSLWIPHRTRAYVPSRRCSSYYPDRCWRPVYRRDYTRYRVCHPTYYMGRSYCTSYRY